MCYSNVIVSCGPKSKVDLHEVVCGDLKEIQNERGRVWDIT